MKTPLVTITAGWTGVLTPFTLKIDGQAVDLTNYTVTLILHKESGVSVTAGGQITKLNQATNRGQVSYSPIASDFVLETGRNTIVQYYTLQFKVEDSLGKVVDWPNGEPERVAVWRS